ARGVFDWHLLCTTERRTHARGSMPNASHLACTFCDIIRGAGEVSMCYEDTEVVAFLDVQPVNPGHVLVVPREHFESLEDIPYVLAMHLFDVAMELAPVVKQVAGAGGLNVVVNSGAAAGQDIFHYHVHVIPRRADDGFDIPLPFGGSEMPDRTVLDMNAARIIAAFRDPVNVRVRSERRSGSTDRRVTDEKQM
ncbi:MAG TPA: HIT family protein, partial [Gemmatimonadaceae bacterium]